MHYKGILCALFISQAMHAGVVICSIPKCGSNLLKALLQELGYAYKGNLVERTYLHLSEAGLNRELGENGCTITHAIPTQENIDIVRRTGHKAIYIYRDPRDQVISCARYMKQLLGGKFWVAAQLPFDDLVTELIVNYKIKGQAYKKGLWSDPVFDDMGSVVDFYHMYMPWQDCPDVYTVNFEKLVGAKGGGSDAEQYQEISNICAYLGLERSPEQIKALGDNLFGNKKSLTFVKGLIGQWRETFCSAQKLIFKIFANDLLVELGYEKDYSW